MFKLLDSHLEYKETEYDFSGYEDTVKEAYEIEPSILEFNENNIAILKMDTLILGVTDGERYMSMGNSIYTEEQDQCVGYIIVERLEDGELEVDTSHICDMINY